MITGQGFFREEETERFEHMTNVYMVSSSSTKLVSPCPTLVIEKLWYDQR